MSRFDLTFRGSILPEVDPAVARERFGRFFGLDDPARIEPFFAGGEITLRRNLNRKQAAEYYLKLRHLGLETTLVKVAVPASSSAPAKTAARPVQPDPAAAPADVAPVPATAGAARQTGRSGARPRPLTTPHPANRQPAPGAAPNPYALRPFQNSRALSGRAVGATRLRRLALATALAMLALLLLLIWYVAAAGSRSDAPRLSAAAGNQRGELVLSTDSLLLFHDRSGAETGVFDLEQLELPGPVVALEYLLDDELVLLVETPAGSRQVFHCATLPGSCTGLSNSEGPLAADALAADRHGARLILASHTRQQLSLHDYSGRQLASRPLALPQRPVLRIHGGLLFVNADEGPAINVLRYEQEAFGEQLDQILLLPAGDYGATFTQNHDFTWAGQYWWTVLGDPATGDRQLFRFDELWRFVAAVPLPPDHRPASLIPWQEKLLVLDPRQTVLLRFSETAVAEAPLQSATAQTLAEDATRRRMIIARLGRLGSATLLLGTVAALLFAGLQQLRYRTFSHFRYRNAAILDPHITRLHWLSLPARPCLRRLRLWAGAVPGHIGVRGTELVLVDHRGVYQIGAGPQIHRHRYFLLLDEVLVYTGSRWLPEFETAEWRQFMPPVLANAQRLDSGRLLVMLCEHRHPLLPLAAGSLALAVTAVAFVFA
ncbi:hypothetical protein [Kineobactrum salinum]|uniref:Uncharacterized protein n=1 Tax=Kineobactrum salinum TaxID=2708301 RepID=A0A6C0TWP6_9GAMM|nr:hypothetical protein [Kineobactrum salinum]QIB64240.1 hypothetical protein G3T16_01270 [Kineobactrum salinum]